MKTMFFLNNSYDNNHIPKDKIWNEFALKERILIPASSYHRCASSCQKLVLYYYYHYYHSFLLIDF